MKHRTSRFFISAIAAVSVMGLTACNNDGLVNAPAAPTPTPTDAPTPQAPIAEIDNGLPVYSTIDTASFDGSYSYDPDGYIVSYAWELETAPPSSTSALTPSGDGSYSSFFIDIAGDYKIKLTVTDDSGLTGSTEFAFSAVPSAFHVELSWPAQYGQADIDLHVINQSAVPTPALWDLTNDCHYRNCKPSSGEILDWGLVNDPTDNPNLDVDNIDQAVPENTNIVAPVNGTYRIEVHYYGSSVSTTAPVDVKVRVFINADPLNPNPAFVSSATLMAVDNVWTVGDVVWSSGAGLVTPINTMGVTVKPGF